MRHSESGKEVFKRRRKKGAQFQKRKESAIIAVRRDISPGSADYPRSITRKPTILRRNEDEGFRRSLN
jgi:ribosomal protein L34